MPSILTFYFKDENNSSRSYIYLINLGTSASHNTFGVSISMKSALEKETLRVGWFAE